MKPQMSVLSMQVTYQCNIACKHCGPYCAPDQYDWMSLAEIADLIRQAAALGVQNVVFTGGEPSLLGDDLIGLFHLIHRDLKIPFSRIVTNGKFGSSYEKARRILGAWKTAGLVEVNISCGEFHQEFIPLEVVANAYRAARDLGFSTVLLAGEFLKPGAGKFTPEMYENAIGERLLPPDEASPYASRCLGMSRAPAMPYGRGKDHIKPDQLRLVDESQISSICRDVLGVITVHPNGNTTACCGIMVRDESLLNIGDWRRTPLEQIVADANQDIVLNWIRYLGLKDMKEWLRKKDPSLSFRSEYQNICDLCAELVYNPRAQDLLLQHGAERRDDILVNKVAFDATTGRMSYGGQPE
jgi:hypothetical protein